MKADWWRAWHGLTTDPKWTIVARQAKVARGIAIAVAVRLMERASEAEDRGSIEGYDPEVIAEIVGAEARRVEAVIAAMREKGIVAGERFAAWERRQPAREREDDDSAERTRKWRARKKTEKREDAPSDAVTHVTQGDAMKRLESESEERRLDSADSGGRARSDLAGGEASMNGDRAGEGMAADMRALEARCLALVIDQPVAADPNFLPISRLIGEGFGPDQVLEGVRQALGKLSTPPRTWGAFVGYIRRVPPGRANVLDLRPRAGPGAPPGRESNVAATVRQLREIRAEDALRAGEPA